MLEAHLYRHGLYRFMEQNHYAKDNFCSYCGHPFEPDQPWPRTCRSCNNKTYRNPLPVSVVLLPVGNGLLTVRRNIEPAKGKLALPGGFIELGETWQEAGARELREEAGVEIDSSTLEPFRVFSAPDDTIIIIGLAPPHRHDQLPAFRSTYESSERVIVDGPVDMAFPTHTQAVEAYFTDNHQGDEVAL